MTELEFYNTIYKDLTESNKPFHFEVPKNYFDVPTALLFLSNLKDYAYNCYGIYETINLQLNPSISSVMQFSKTCNKVPTYSNDNEDVVNFLIDFNEIKSMNFPSYWWSAVYDIAEIKDGEFVNEVICR
jgi:hypothetical protein